ncbi:MAG TPA: D-glycero-beta-D-manno-heptose-7-phosphate kinase [Pirellulales bacterium]
MIQSATIRDVPLGGRDDAVFEPWLECLGRLDGARVACVGDIMLDCFIRGSVQRISPEAPIPVLNVSTEEWCVGGVGNVARNISALGAQCCLTAVIGDDAAGGRLQQELAAITRLEASMIIESGRPTTTKTRCVCGSQQLLRIDREVRQPIAPASAAQWLETVRNHCRRAQVVVISDYDKGALTGDTLRATIDAARQAGIPVVVDPKGHDYAKYRGATLITPNRSELAQATQMPVDTLADVERAARALQTTLDIEVVCATLSEEGMLLVRRSGPAVHHPAEAHEVYDVSGAGDTVVAVLAASLAVGASLEIAAGLANLAAGIVVGKRGTATVDRSELLRQLRSAASHSAGSKVVAAEHAIPQIADWRAEGRSVGFTNGCFDIIHPGHCALLESAARRVDKLIVGLNSDASVRRLKGPTRPVQDELSRATVLASLAYVDLVVLFDDDTPRKLIEVFRPDALFKGADYHLENVVGADFVQSYGGRVELLELIPKQSTSKLVARMCQAAD